MYLSDFTYDSSTLHKFDLSPKDPSLSNKGNNTNGIAPWGTGDKILGNIPSSMKAQRLNQKNHSSPSKSQFEHENSFDVIEIPQKGRTNRSNLGKFQKVNKNMKTNQQFHLPMNKIQFGQHDIKMQMQNQNKLFFKANQKINIKDFSSLDNNFFIRSYFFPNSIKTPNRRGQADSLDQKKKNQYKNLKQIQPSAFLAIKSVDLKAKFLKNQKTRDQTKCPLKNENYYQKYRTISVMSSGRKQRNQAEQQFHQHYQLKLSNAQVKKHYDTIESTKQSSKSNYESFRQQHIIIAKETAKNDKLNQTDETIAIEPSFIRSPFDEHFLRIEQPPISKDKTVNPSKEKHFVIAGIKRLKLKNNQQNITSFIEPKPNRRPKYSTITHNFSSRQSDRPYKKAYTQSPKRIQIFESNKNHSNRLIAYDQQAQGDRTSFYEVNKSGFLFNDTKEKTFILK